MQTKGTEILREEICNITKKSFSSGSSIFAGLVVRHCDLSHKMSLSHEDHMPECDNVNRLSQIPYHPTFLQQQTCF